MVDESQFHVLKTCLGKFDYLHTYETLFVKRDSIKPHLKRGQHFNRVLVPNSSFNLFINNFCS
jgi:hypothetical protein